MPLGRASALVFHMVNVVFHMVDVFGGDDLCSGQWWWRCSCDQSSQRKFCSKAGESPQCRGHIFKELNCTGQQQLCDNTPNLNLHGQHEGFSQSNEVLGALGINISLPTSLINPAILKKAQFIFSLNFFIIKMCFGSETAPASRVLLVLLFFGVFFFLQEHVVTRQEGMASN